MCKCIIPIQFVFHQLEVPLHVAYVYYNETNRGRSTSVQDTTPFRRLQPLTTLARWKCTEMYNSEQSLQFPFSPVSSLSLKWCAASQTWTSTSPVFDPPPAKDTNNIIWRNHNSIISRCKLEEVFAIIYKLYYIGSPFCVCIVKWQQARNYLYIPCVRIMSEWIMFENLHRKLWAALVR